MSTDKRLEYLKLLDKLSEAFGESDGQSPDEIRNELREEGFDIDSAEAELLKFKQKISKASKMKALDEAKLQRKALATKEKGIIDKIKNWTIEQVIERLKDLSNSEPDLVFAYRDLKIGKENTIEDIKAVIIDVELARLLSEEDEYGSN